MDVTCRLIKICRRLQDIEDILESGFANESVTAELLLEYQGLEEEYEELVPASDPS